MEKQIFGAALTAVLPFAVLGLAAAARKWGAGAETSRKLVHILLSNWILLALAVYRSAWTACILPACFILLNYISYRKGLFSAIEREVDNTPGTVWYAVSLFLLCLAGYSLGTPWIAACGMLAMGYGDGLGALVGKRWGRSRFPKPCEEKSLEGMLAVLAFSGLAVGAACAAYVQSPPFALRAALACAVPAAAVELFTPRGLDNLTLPLGVSLIVYLLARFPQLWPVFACLSLTLLILLAAYYLRAITGSGLWWALLLGVALFLAGGWTSYGALVLFFITGSLASRVGKSRKAAAERLHERQGARSTVQVLANGLPSLLFAGAHALTGREGCLLAVLACFAAAAADTCSSEIGMLSKRAPVSILTGKPGTRGLSGGVTPLGLWAGTGGALLISALAVPGFGAGGMLASAAAGFAGSVLDSVLGAAFQAKYHAENGETECPRSGGEALELSRGIRWVNNDVVNFVSVFLCGLTLAAAWRG